MSLDRLNKVPEALQRVLLGRASLISYPSLQMIEVMPYEASKGSGLKRLCESWNIAKERVAAFGDGENDVDLFRMAGLCIAMENARPELKTLAHRVAPHHDDCGVARILCEMFSLEITYEATRRTNVPAPRNIFSWMLADRPFLSPFKGGGTRLVQ